MGVIYLCINLKKVDWQSLPLKTIDSEVTQLTQTLAGQPLDPSLIF